VIGEYDAMIVRGRHQGHCGGHRRWPRLRVVGRGRAWCGYIDLQAAQSHGRASAWLTCARFHHHWQSPSLTLGLLLALGPQPARADAAMKAGRWLKKDLVGMEISGKTLG